MTDRNRFAKALARLHLSHAERAIAFLWFYRQNQSFDERTAAELAVDMHDEGFPRPNVTVLSRDLDKSRSTTRGKRKKTFQIDLRGIDNLDKAYLPLIDLPVHDVSNAVVPRGMLAGTRRLYLERLVHQINGAYDAGFYDACAVLCRRLMESLIIESFIANNIRSKIEANGAFASLDRLIAAIKSETSFSLGRNSGSTMDLVKQAGDTAAHDRTYITQKQDIDDLKGRFRTLISALLSNSKIL